MVLSANRLLLPLLLFSMTGPSVARAIDLSGNWAYAENDDGTEQLSTFNERYGFNFSQQLTRAVSFNGGVNYTKQWTENSGTNQTLQPSVSLAASNDIFTAGFNGYLTESTDTQDVDRSDRSWESSLSSAWRKKLWPNLYLRYGERTSSNDLALDEAGAREQDEKRYGASADWDLLLGQVYYAYSESRIDDVVELSVSENKNHFAKFTTGKTFWQDKVSVNFSQQVNQSQQSFQALLGPGGYALRPKSLVGVMVVNDSTPTVSSMGTAQTALRDGDYDTSVPAAALQPIPYPLPNEQTNITIQLPPTDPAVDVIYVYTGVLPLGVDPNNVGFDLYVLTDPNILTGWTNFANLPAGTVPYDTVNHRYMISIAQRSNQYLKLVASNTNFGQVVPVTEVTAFQKEYSSKTEQKNTQHSTNFGVGYRINPALNLDYSLSYQKTEVDGRTTDLETTTHATSLRWDPRTIWSSQLSASQSRNTDGINPENMGRSYSLGMSLRPMTTLNFNLGLARSESYQGGMKSSTGHSLVLTTIADLYRDLSSALDLSYNTSKSEASGDTAKDYGTQLRLTARLSPKLTVDLSERYARNIGTAESMNSGSTDLNLSYRISEMLYLSTGASNYWRDNSDDTNTYNLGVTLVPTAKTQVSLHYAFMTSTWTSENYTLNWNWAISQFLSLNAFGRYLMTDQEETGDQWTIGTQLSARTMGL